MSEELRLKCAVIDDEPLAAELIAGYVKKTSFLELTGVYGGAVSAVPHLKEESVDLLFLDIQMPDLNGLELSKLLPETTRVIFTTAFAQYAVESYRVSALDYLLKPVRYVDFLQAANKALHWFKMMDKAETADQSAPDASSAEPDTIFLKVDQQYRQVELSKILYIEGMGDYVKVFIEEEKLPLVSLITLKALEGVLPADRFMRVHRSYIVQPEKVRVIERGRIVFGTERIPVTDTFRERFEEFLKQKALIFPKI